MFERIKENRNKRKLAKEKKKLEIKEIEKQKIEEEKRLIEEEDERLRNLDSKEVQVEMIKAMRGIYSKYETLVQKSIEQEAEINVLRANISYLEDRINSIGSDNYNSYE